MSVPERILSAERKIMVGALQIGHATQKLNLVLPQFALPFQAPLAPVRADVLQLGRLVAQAVEILHPAGNRASSVRVVFDTRKPYVCTV